MAINGKSNWREPAYLSGVDDGQQVLLQSLLLKPFARVRNIEMALNRTVVLILRSWVFFSCCCCSQVAVICAVPKLNVFSLFY